MLAYEFCRKYQEALNQRKLEEILELFNADAMVQAPIAGRLGVAEFHRRLFTNDSRAIARLKHVFYALSRQYSVALQFTYLWVTHDGNTIPIDGIVLFDIDEATRKFCQLQIIYDPTELKRYFAEANIQSIGLG